MGRHRQAGARAPWRGRAASLIVAALGSALLVLLAPSPAGATGQVTLYAYPLGALTNPTSCPQSSTASSQCSLAGAIALAEGSGESGNDVTISLAPGGYVDSANFVVTDTNAGSLTLEGSS